MKSDILFVALIIVMLVFAVMSVWINIELMKVLANAPNFNWWVVVGWVVSFICVIGVGQWHMKTSKPDNHSIMKKSAKFHHTRAEKLIKVGAPKPFQTKNKGIDLRDIRCCSTNPNSIESGISFDEGENGKAILRFHFLEDNGFGLFQTEKHMHLNEENAKELICHLLSFFPALGNLLQWTLYDFEQKSTRPPKPGRYLVYRLKCRKMHFEHWNGSGWASSNNEELIWSDPFSTLKTL